jgi:hypothetical protein
MSSTLKPSADQMRLHLQHLFGDLPQDLQAAAIEIVYTGPGPKDRALTHARYFSPSQIDEAVEFARRTNTLGERSLYIGAGLRKPGLEKRRSKSEDVLALTALYIDLDDEAANQSAEEKFKHCPPTAIVITGHIPHLRQQLWWKLDAPLYDLNAASRYLETLARTFGGDPAITNAIGLMRFGGTVAWPKKKGRVAEMTEFVPCDGGANVRS